MLSFFKVSGDSMLPAVKSGDYLIVENFTYKFREPKEGEIAVLNKFGRILVKRIVKKSEDGYFVEGDNKNFSTDSRNFGFVEKNYILGKVIVL